MVVIAVVILADENHAFGGELGGQLVERKRRV